MTLFRNTLIISSSFFVAMIFLLSAVTPSFAFMLGDADPLLNNIWLEPENPKPGDTISIHSSIYNQGTQSTKEVTDVVTIGYFINGDLVKLSTLTDVRPGVENGIEISTGPIWKTTDGIHTVTVILNYHDTLSHLSDNFENNIMQKKYYIGNWQSLLHNLISFELSQEAIPNTQNQIVKITGTITLPENYPKYRTPRINLEFNDEKDVVHKNSILVNKDTNSFYWRETMAISNTIIPITASLSDSRYNNNPFYHYTLNLYPITLNQNESLFVLKLPNSTESNNFKNKKFDVVIYDESYQLIKKYETTQISDYPIKKIETIQLPASPFEEDIPITQPNPVVSTNPDGDLIYIILPGGKSYNFEIYSENNLEYSGLKFLKPNNILNDILETKNNYNVNLNQNESLLFLQLSEPNNSYTFRNSEFVIIVFQDSYENLFKQISTYGNSELILTSDEDLLTVLPANHNYIIEIYLNGEFINSFETFLKSKDVITKQIFIPKFIQTNSEIIDELNNSLKIISAETWKYSTITNESEFVKGFKVIPVINNGKPIKSLTNFSDVPLAYSEWFQDESEKNKFFIKMSGDHNP